MKRMKVHLRRGMPRFDIYCLLPVGGLRMPCLTAEIGVL